MAKGMKTGGRTKGTPNKLTNSTRETLADVLNDYTIESLKSDLSDLTPYERIKVIANLYRFALPPIKPEAPEDNKEMQPIIITGMRFIDNGSKD